jgi:hypothetical protein
MKLMFVQNDITPAAIYLGYKALHITKIASHKATK